MALYNFGCSPLKCFIFVQIKMTLQQIAISFWWRGLCASVTLKGLLLWRQEPDWATQGKVFSAHWLDRWLLTECPLISFKHLELGRLSLVYLTCKQNEKIHCLSLSCKTTHMMLIWCSYQQDVCICQCLPSPLQMIIIKWFIWPLCDLPNVVKVRLGLGTKNYFIIFGND